ncbi:uncharacterized protein LOC126059733 isoform X2 [Elephas maximus indicus]|uniref:uncharacterized protein LOC126059733 isoform X2 n=1 Tax=Elephas maximus indicus TaxID=99487 RepID=UPI002116AB41|nr:uncharacterized protein LOC126059733 isoform X2 [Elephas maximus indicus]
MAKKNHIPSGWRTVTPIGHRLPGTRFIAFKVPFKGINSSEFIVLMELTEQGTLYVGTSLMLKAGIQIQQFKLLARPVVIK